MNKIFFVIGASGSGKTTVVKAFENMNEPNFMILYFDQIGVPSLEEMMTKYNGPEEWQRIKTIEWVKVIKERFLADSHIILDAQTRPLFIQEACLENKINTYQTILLDCTDQERSKRLHRRGQPELANEHMMNWANYLRLECHKKGDLIVDNSNHTIDQTLKQFQEWLKKE